MSEAVEMIISADDQASKKFAQVAANAERDLGKVKTAGEKLKGVAGVGGALTKMLGGTELGGQVAQIGELTEKVNQFGQVAKMGQAGALAFQAGLAGLVAVMSFELGKSIGNAIFGTEAFNKKLDEAREKSSALNSQLMDLRQRGFAEDIANIKLIPDADKQEAELRAMFERMKKDEQAWLQTIEANAKKVKQLRSGISFTNESAEQANNLVRQSNQLVDQIDQARRQQQQINEALRARPQAATQAFNQSLEALARESVLLTEGESAAERWSLARQGMTKEQISWIVGIREQNNELKKANAEKEKAAQQAAKVADAYSNAATSIKKQRIALEEGEEAARKFELVQQGMSDAMAERIAEEERMLKLDAQRKQIANSFIEQRIAIEQGTEAARAYRLEQEGYTAAEAKRHAAEEKKLRGTEVAKQALEDLRMRRLELEKGAEAARKEQLMLQGVDEATAARIANEEKLLQAREEAKQASAEPAGPVAARESRMLSGRGIAMENVSKQQLQTLIDIHQAIRDQEKKSKVRLVQVQK